METKNISTEEMLTKTENGMVTYTTSLNKCLDLFFKGGAMRQRSETEIINLFSEAYNEDPSITMKLLGWIRDARMGAGERRFAKICLKWLSSKDENFDKLLYITKELGRWDDILELLDSQYETKVLDSIKTSLENGDGLLAKWLDRKGPIANKIRKFMGLTPKEYRKLLVGLTKVVETQMCNKEWSEIEYTKVPSLAMSKYGRAFGRHDQARFASFIESAKKGEVKINASVVYPHQLVTKVLSDRGTATAQWNQLPNWIGDSNCKFLPVCDVSGSMAGLPMDVSVGLGIYLSERNKSIFKDGFITFSSNPKLQYLKGDLYERVNQLRMAEWGMTTNLEEVFNLILNVATKNNLTSDQLPESILIISDMEFNSATRFNDNAMDMISNKYESNGYKRPNIVFWNVNASSKNIPVKFDEKGTALISGFSPSIMTSLLSGDINPMKIMMNTINKERYNILG